MLNRYPLWKNLAITFVVVLGVLYSLPNLFGEDPAIQVRMAEGAEMTEARKNRIAGVLQRVDVEPLQTESVGKSALLIRLKDKAAQKIAFNALRGGLDSKLYQVALNMAARTPDVLKSIGGQPVGLGLDLRGGVHLLAEVSMDDVDKAGVEELVDQILDYGVSNDLKNMTVRKKGSVVSITSRRKQDWTTVIEGLQKEIPTAKFSQAKDENGDPIPARYRAVVTEVERQRRRAFAVEQNVLTLRTRVDSLGVAEPLVQRQGKDRILIQLPGVDDAAEAKERLEATASIEYRLVHPTDYPANTKARQVARNLTYVPRFKVYQDKQGEPILLSTRKIVDGTHLENATAGRDNVGRPAVNVTLNASGASRMQKTTVNNVHKPMAVIYSEFDSDTRTKTEYVISVASINGAFGKNFQTTGLDAREAATLSKALRAGALAAPFYFVEERTIGPSLGKENVERGTKAMVLGFLLVMLFMLIYYKVFGLIANIALLANVVLVLGIMSLPVVPAALTLPGIAGLVLTVGMAVDANVLIFERIREELRAGQTIQTAINAGYDRAFVTIADANVTTIIAAIVLFAAGAGPIKGFSITLILGILTSMFTAILGTRMLVNLVYGGRRVEKLSI